MKYLLTLIVLVGLSAYAQDTLVQYKPSYYEGDTRAVVALKGANVVYRGVDNIISVAAMGVHAWDTRIITPGNLRSTGRTGEFRWDVTEILDETATIKIIYKEDDGTYNTEEREFEIHDLKPFMPMINGYGGYGCTVELSLEEFKGARISVKAMEDIILKELRDIKVRSFSIQLPTKALNVEGDAITDIAYTELKDLQPGTIIYITNINYTTQKSSFDYGKNQNIKIMVSGNK